MFGYDTGTINGIIAMQYFRRQFSTGYIDTKDNMPNLTPAQSSLLVSILSAGTFVGALVAAPVGDKLGRRPSLIIAIAVFAFGVSLQTASSAIPLFVCGRWAVSLACCEIYVTNSFTDFLPALVLESFPYLSHYTNLRWLPNGFEVLLSVHTNLPLLPVYSLQQS